MTHILKSAAAALIDAGASAATVTERAEWSHSSGRLDPPGIYSLLPPSLLCVSFRALPSQHPPRAPQIRQSHLFLSHRIKATIN